MVNIVRERTHKSLKTLDLSEEQTTIGVEVPKRDDDTGRLVDSFKGFQTLKFLRVDVGMLLKPSDLAELVGPAEKEKYHDLLSRSDYTLNNILPASIEELVLENELTKIDADHMFARRRDFKENLPRLRLIRFENRLAQFPLEDKVIKECPSYDIKMEAGDTCQKRPTYFRESW